MFRILIDTSVWLDLAKDPKSVPLLEVLEPLIKSREASLIVPKIVIDEFQRNKLELQKPEPRA